MLQNQEIPLEECFSLEFFGMKHYNVFNFFANNVKHAPKAKMVVMRRKQSNLIHFHSEIIFSGCN